MCLSAYEWVVNPIRQALIKELSDEELSEEEARLLLINLAKQPIYKETR